jgi:sRNA-binding regulator protein Hfq
MKRKLEILCLTFLLVFAPLTRAVRAQGQTDINKTEKVKAEVAKRVASKKTKVKIKLHSGEELKGRIAQADDGSFTVTEDKTGKQVQLPYGDVDSVKGRGGLSTGAKIGIIAAIAVAVVAVVAVIAVKNFDPFQGGITVR